MIYTLPHDFGSRCGGRSFSKRAFLLHERDLNHTIPPQQLLVSAGSSAAASSAVALAASEERLPQQRAQRALLVDRDAAAVQVHVQ